MTSLVFSSCLELSRKRVKVQVLLLHKIHVWHIDGGHITQEVQYKLRETPHSDASKQPKCQQDLLQLIPQTAFFCIYIQQHMSKDLERSLKMKMFIVQ